MIKLYGLFSPHVYKVRAVLMQKGLEFEHYTVNMRQRSDEFNALSAIGKIPILDDDGAVIWDSFNIALYLDRKYTQKSVFPNDPDDYAKVLNVVSLTNFINDLVVPLLIEKYNIAEPLKAGGFSHRALLFDQKQKDDLQKDLKYRHERLAKLKMGKYFVGNRLTYADICVFALLQGILEGDSAKEYSNTELREWYESIKPELEHCITPMDSKPVREI